MNLAKALGATLFGVIAVSVILLNMFGGLVSGIWLAIEGQWRLILAGVVLIFVMPWAWVIASLPALGLGALLAALSEIPSRVGVAIVGFILSLWYSLLNTVWVYFVFQLFANRAQPDTTIPLLIWGYATTMAPLSYMASKDRPDNTASSLALLHAFLAYAVVLLSHLAGADVIARITWLTGLALLQAAFAALLGVSMTPRRSSITVTDESRPAP